MIQKKQLERLGNEKVAKLVLSFSSTAVVGLILNTIYNLTDTLFVSWGVGDVAMGGVSIVFPFVMFQSMISTTIGGGAAVLVSQKLGEGHAQESGNITRNAIVLFYIISVMSTIFGFIFMREFLVIMGVTDELLPYASDYFQIILIGNVFSTGFSSIIRAEGKNAYSMLIWVVPITINIILDAIFILVLGWGIKGSAAATVISQFISFVISVIFFAKFTTQDYTNAKLKWRTIGEILKVGLPSLINMGSLSVIMLIMNAVISEISGTIGIVTFGYISKLIMYAIVPFMGITQSISPIVGYNHGILRNDRIKETVVFCVKISFIYALVILIILESMPQYLLMIFTNNTDIIKLGIEGIRIVAVSMLFTPLPMIIGATMQATGKTLWSLIIYGSNLVFIILPVLLLGKYFGMIGVLWSYVIAYFISTLLVITKLLVSSGRSLMS